MVGQPWHCKEGRQPNNKANKWLCRMFLQKAGCGDTLRSSTWCAGEWVSVSFRKVFCLRSDLQAYDKPSWWIWYDPLSGYLGETHVSKERTLLSCWLSAPAQSQLLQRNWSKLSTQYLTIRSQPRTLNWNNSFLPGNKSLFLE